MPGGSWSWRRVMLVVGGLGFQRRQPLFWGRSWGFCGTLLWTLRILVVQAVCLAASAYVDPRPCCKLCGQSFASRRLRDGPAMHRGSSVCSGIFCLPKTRWAVNRDTRSADCGIRHKKESRQHMGSSGACPHQVSYENVDWRLDSSITTPTRVLRGNSLSCNGARGPVVL